MRKDDRGKLQRGADKQRWKPFLQTNNSGKGGMMSCVNISQLSGCIHFFIKKVIHEGLKNGLVYILFIPILLAFTGCGPAKPLSLGQFGEISFVSISNDGNQIMFDGCDHKEYESCTLYRFDRANNKLYRYLPRTDKEELCCARYSQSSNRFVFSVIPITKEVGLDYESTQIALMDQDANGFKILTKGPGLKTRAALSYDERQLAFFKSHMSSAGSPLKKKRNRSVGYDLYNIDLASGKEVRLTSFEYYEIGAPYFTSDNTMVLFEGDSPMRSPDSSTALLYRKQMEKKYGSNRIFKVPIDGSTNGQSLAPHFTINSGSRLPVLLEDNSIIFEGLVGFQGFIHYYIRYPDGKLEEIKYEELGRGKDEKGQIIFVREMTATPDGRFMAILNYNQGNGQRFLWVRDMVNKKLINITLPTISENIVIKQGK